MRSNNLRPFDGRAEQALLPLPISTAMVADEVVRRLSTMTKAVALCVQVSGLEEKEIYRSLEIDAGHWTRIVKGDAHFPLNKLNDLCNLCGNEIPLEWWAWSRGKGLVMLESEAEREMRVQRTRAETAEERIRYLEALVTGRVNT